MPGPHRLLGKIREPAFHLRPHSPWLGDKSGGRLPRPRAALFDAGKAPFPLLKVRASPARRGWILGARHPSPPPAPFSVYSPSVSLHVCLPLLSLSPFASHHPFLSLFSLLRPVTQLSHLLSSASHAECHVSWWRESGRGGWGAGGREDFPTQKPVLLWEEGLAVGVKCSAEGVGGRCQELPCSFRGTPSLMPSQQTLGRWPLGGVSTSSLWPAESVFSVSLTLPGSLWAHCSRKRQEPL